MKKSLFFDEVEYAMVEALAKKSRLKPDQYLKNLIHQEYERLK